MNDKLKWEKVKVAEDEITTRWQERAEIEDYEQLDEAARLSQTDRFWPMIEALADLCDKILSENDFPNAAESVRHDGEGNWWRHPPDAPKRPPPSETWRFTYGCDLARNYAGDFSDAWYAGEIGLKCRIALEKHRKGHAGEPWLLSQIFAIATLRSDWLWRRQHKPQILTGRKIRKGLDERRIAKNAEQRELMEDRRRNIELLLLQTGRSGGALEDYLICELRKRGHETLSRRTIRRDLKALRER